MTRMSLRWRWLLAFCACVAQLVLPVAHAALMAAAPTHMPGWCGQRSATALAAIAALPPELRDALLADDDAAADHLAACAQLCVGASPLPLPPEGHVATEALRAAGLEPAVATHAPVRLVSQSAPPPSHAPPTRF